MCNMDCLNCVYDDCINDKVTDTERRKQDKYDRENISERIPEERSNLRKRKLALYDYNHSEKGKAAQKRYAQSEKGKARDRRKAQKRIASGKNAEYCRRYREKKKAEREAQREKHIAEK